MLIVRIPGAVAILLATVRIFGIIHMDMIHDDDGNDDENARRALTMPTLMFLMILG